MRANTMATTIRRYSATENSITAINDKGQVRKVDLSYMSPDEQNHQIRQTLKHDGREHLVYK